MWCGVVPIVAIRTWGTNTHGARTGHARDTHVLPLCMWSRNLLQAHSDAPHSHEGVESEARSPAEQQPEAPMITHIDTHTHTHTRERGHSDASSRLGLSDLQFHYVRPPNRRHTHTADSHTVDRTSELEFEVRYCVCVCVCVSTSMCVCAQCVRLSK